MARDGRPRERLTRLGPAALGDAELVALVIGHGSRQGDALEIGFSLLARYGSLDRLLHAEPTELRRVPGIGPARAAQLVAALELGKRALCSATRPPTVVRTAADVHRLFRPVVVGLGQEVFWALALSVRHRVIRPLKVATGSLSSVDVHPREVFRPLIRVGAAATILVHNHPSGDPSPSREDFQLTQRLSDVGELTGIPVLDHVVVTASDYVSLAEAGQLG